MYAHQLVIYIATRLTDVSQPAFGHSQLVTILGISSAPKHLKAERLVNNIFMPLC